jgi:para-nitrobenzyl esterase
VLVYKGIAFAAPPVGELRWKPPQPVVPWEGVREAADFGPTCPQTPYPAGSVFPQGAQPDRVSEDCLYLNDWTAETAATEPVLAWIHGGAMIRGAGSYPLHDGAALAAKGAVVVTINYRLGAFGLLAHPELTAESEHHASGNYALPDQVAALEWVQRNIRGFGGDPERVAICGQSAGSSSVATLLASPLATGLCQRAIGESGGAFVGMPRLEQVEGSGAKWASSFTDGSLAGLRDKGAEEILGATPPGNLFFSFNVDGWAPPRDFTTTFAQGAQNDVPTMVGYNADEMTALAPFPPTPAENCVAATRRQYAALTDDFLKIYPVRTDDDARAAHYASLRDLLIGWGGGGVLLGAGGDRDREVEGVCGLLHPSPARPRQRAARRIP